MLVRVIPLNFGHYPRDEICAKLHQSVDLDNSPHDRVEAFGRFLAKFFSQL